MAFTATYTLKLNNNPASTPVTLTQAACYFKLGNISGGKETGYYTAPLKVYVNQQTRNNDLGDIIDLASAPALPIAVTPYVANVDPYPALYAVAKSPYTDAVDVI
jgi:hypothetical protein